MSNYEKRNKKRKKHSRLKLWMKLCLLCIMVCLLCRGMSYVCGNAGSRNGLTLGQWRNKAQETKEVNAILKNREYPGSLRELVRNNPETIGFVEHYPEKKDFQGKIDVSDDLKGDIPLFLQWDERWGYRQYGGDFMAVNGCGPTCLSMVWCGLTGKSKWNPYKVAQKAEKEGYYVKGAGTSWELMTNGAEALGLKVENLSLNEKYILDCLKTHHPIICVVGPGDFTTQGHFLVLTGVDEDGKILINDPNSPKRSDKKWELKRLLPQIRNLWAYSV